MIPTELNTKPTLVSRQSHIGMPQAKQEPRTSQIQITEYAKTFEAQQYKSEKLAEGFTAEYNEDGSIKRFYKPKKSYYTFYKDTNERLV